MCFCKFETEHKKIPPRSSILSRHDVLYIRDNSYIPLKDLAEKFNVSRQAIAKVKSYESYPLIMNSDSEDDLISPKKIVSKRQVKKVTKHVQRSLKRRRATFLSAQDRAFIQESVKNGIDLAKQFNVDKSTISRIKSRK